MGTSRLSEPFVCSQQIILRENVGHLGKFSNRYITKQANEENQDTYSAQEKQKVGQEWKRCQNRHISLILRGMFSHFTESEIRPRLSIKGILQSPLAGCSLDGVVSNCTGLNLFITPGMLNQQQQATDISVLKPLKDHMRRDCESWLVRNLLWTPADKIKKAPASNLSSGGNNLK